MKFIKKKKKKKNLFLVLEIKVEHHIQQNISLVYFLNLTDNLISNTHDTESFDFVMILLITLMKKKIKFKNHFSFA